MTIPDATHPFVRVCAVCARVLDYRADEDVFVHPFWLDADHPAVPASPTDIHYTGTCDFCGEANNPAWELPVHDFEYGTMIVAPGSELDGRRDANRGDWACCDECKTFIEAGKWGGLLRRFQRLHQARDETYAPGDRLAIEVVRRNWMMMRDHIAGPIRPSTLPRPPAR
jgi:hypothetical protein